jgi:predicted Zn-dependent peptidase
MISAETLTSHWPRVMETIGDVLKNANFPSRELERVRKEHLADLKRMSTDPVAISHRATRAIVYGPDTPYGHSVSGTQASTVAITRDEVVAHFEGRFGPGNATLIAVGDIRMDELMSKAIEHLGDWSRAASPGAEIVHDPDIAPAPTTTVYLVDRPGAPQTVISAAHKTIARLEPDYFPMVLVNYVFGGHSSARLFMNLRQDKGYSYGYYSQIDWLPGQSALIAGGSVQTAVTKEALVETLKEFADIRGDRAVTRKELDEAQVGMLRGFPSQFETQGQILQATSILSMFGLPDDYYSGVMERLSSQSLEEVRAVASRRIDDGHLAVVVVGDRQAIEPGIQELGLPIIEVDDEGRPV